MTNVKNIMPMSYGGYTIYITVHGKRHASFKSVIDGSVIATGRRGSVKAAINAARAACDTHKEHLS